MLTNTHTHICTHTQSLSLSNTHTYSLVRQFEPKTSFCANIPTRFFCSIIFFPCASCPVETTLTAKTLDCIRTDVRCVAKDDEDTNPQSTLAFPYGSKIKSRSPSLYFYFPCWELLCKKLLFATYPFILGTFLQVICFQVKELLVNSHVGNWNSKPVFLTHLFKLIALNDILVAVLKPIFNGFTKWPV